MERQLDVGELMIKISGCINACGHHHAGQIGILGVDRKGTENYQLLRGGSGAEDTSQAKITGPGFDEAGIVDAVERTVERYRELREPGERFLDTYRRVGLDPFKEAIYGSFPLPRRPAARRAGWHARHLSRTARPHRRELGRASLWATAGQTV